ncbi:V-set domain-containing T-cell activation inhibitor 1-like [Erpetoichthys calabaricus]|uniref:V-set domain-containing T-cell activation inhibitor 1-like n=1 Tax=Erpetoichthys calabaricus TaxID=27687 RepID=UPI0022344FE7|nr:V-set domain-containing T-cell activation inhibitor 1-like [Erpetoichthys calabaricus]
MRILTSSQRLRCLKFRILLILSSVHASTVHIHGEKGKVVILPCTFPADDLPSKVNVVWNKLPDTNVHVFSNGKDDPNLQNASFVGRTRLFREEIYKGNLSLRLDDIHESDKGEYKCFVSRTALSKRVTLTVEAPVVTKEKSSRSSSPALHLNVMCLLMLILMLTPLFNLT